MREKKGFSNRRIFNINKESIKVGFDELLYDFIFIILLSKLSEMFIQMLPDMNIYFFITEVSIFIMIYWMWTKKVMLTNNLHVLSKKLDINIPRYNLITYIELTVLILLFYKIDTHITSYFYLFIVLVVIFVNIIYMNIMRHTILGKFQTKEDIIQAIFTFKNVRKEINLDHFLERLEVVTILFLGEILSLSFGLAPNWIHLLLGVIIIFGIFNYNLIIVEAIRVREENNEEVGLKIGRVIRYFRIMLMLLFFVILELDILKDKGNQSILILIGLILVIKLFQIIVLNKLLNRSLNILQVVFVIYFACVLLLTFYYGFTNVITLILIALLILFSLFMDKTKKFSNNKE